MAKLTDPIEINGLRLSNRLVMAPMVTAMAEDHCATDAHVAWYGERAAGGVGLVIVECAAVAPEGILMPRQLGIWSDDHLEGLTRITRAVHAAGIPVVLQLVHGGARSHVVPEATTRVGPSEVRMLPGPSPRSLDASELPAIVQSFVEGARRARAAGFDGVEIHAAHGYLLSQFLMPLVNTRGDGYGGSPEGRARLLVEVIRAVRAEVGQDYPLLVRMHAAEHMRGGLDLEACIGVARMVESAGADALDLSGIAQGVPLKDPSGAYLMTSSVRGNGWTPAIYAEPSGCIRRAVSIPVITVGRMAEGGSAHRVLESMQADLVALGRQIIADPESPRKLLQGRPDTILRCEECLACFASIRTGPVRCTVWPA